MNEGINRPCSFRSAREVRGIVPADQTQKTVTELQTDLDLQDTPQAGAEMYLQTWTRNQNTGRTGLKPFSAKGREICPACDSRINAVVLSLTTELPPLQNGQPRQSFWYGLFWVGVRWLFPDTGSSDCWITGRVCIHSWVTCGCWSTCLGSLPDSSCVIIWSRVGFSNLQLLLVIELRVSSWKIFLKSPR